MNQSSKRGSAIAIIPARGGSKRIPRKNIRPFHGVPLLGRTIGILAASGLFDRVIVSTDDDEIAAVAAEAGAEVPFRRSPDLSDDHTPTVPVIVDAIKQLEQAGSSNIGPVCVAYPAAVFITPADLIAARDLMLTNGAQSVFCAAAHAAPILRSWYRLDNGLAEMIWPEHELTRSQDLEPAFYDTGQFYWWAEGTWQLQAAGESVTTAMYVVERWRVQDIDDEEDWRTAELAFELIQRRGVQ